MKSFLFEAIIFPDNTLKEIADHSVENFRFHHTYHDGIHAKDYFQPSYQKIVKDGCQLLRNKALTSIELHTDLGDQKIVVGLSKDIEKHIHVKFFQLMENQISSTPDWLTESTAHSAFTQTEDWAGVDFQFVLDNATEAIVVHDEEGNILFTNLAFNELCGNHPDKFKLSDFFLFKVHDYNKLKSLLAEKISIPVCLINEDCEQHIEYALQSSELHFRGMKIYGTVVIEIPDLRSRFRNLQQTEQRYRDIVSNMCTIAYAYRYDPKKDVFFMDWINGKTELIPFDDVNDLFDLEKFYGIVHPDDMPVAIHKEEMLRKGKSSFSTMRVTDRSGKQVWITDNNWYVGLSDDGLFRFYGIITDLTAEIMMGNQLNQLWIAINNSSNTIIIIDGEGKIEFVNPAIKNDLGFEPDYFIGNHYKQLLTFVIDKKIETDVAKVINEKKVWSTKLLCRTALADEVVFMVTISPVVGDAGTIEKVIVVSQNISQMMELEKQLFHKDKLSTIGMFASGIAHDFNNILQIISTYSELIAIRSKDDQNTQSYVDQINNAKMRGARLIEHLISFGKPGVLQKKELKISTLIDSNMSFFLELIPKRIKFQSEVTHQLCIYGNETSMQQLFINLIKNAVQAIPESGMIVLKSDLIKAGPLHNKDEMDMISIEVEDNGIGIPGQYLGRVMEPYFSTKKSGDGTGLGLAIVNSIVHDHNGIVRVFSEEQKGTKISVLIPAISKNQYSY